MRQFVRASVIHLNLLNMRSQLVGKQALALGSKAGDDHIYDVWL